MIDVSRYKLISTARADELYEICGDPGEVNDLSAENPDVVSRLSAYLGALEVREGMNKDLGESSRSISDEDALRALGLDNA